MNSVPTSSFPTAIQGLTNNPFFAMKELFLLSNITTIVEELNKEHKLFSPLAETFKRINLGGCCITSAIILCGPHAFSNLLNDLAEAVSDLYNNCSSPKAYYKFTKASAEVVEMGGTFIGFVAENISSFAMYAPTIALAVEIAELGGEISELYEAFYHGYSHWNLHDNAGLEGQVDIARVQLASIKITKSVVKILSIVAAYYACSTLIVTSISAASISLSLGADFYSSYNLEGALRSAVQTRIADYTPAQLLNLLEPAQILEPAQSA